MGLRICRPSPCLLVLVRIVVGFQNMRGKPTGVEGGGSGLGRGTFGVGWLYLLSLRGEVAVGYSLV